MDILGLILCVVTIIAFVVLNIMLLSPQKKRFAFPQFLYIATIGLAAFQIYRNIRLFIADDWYPKEVFAQTIAQTFFLGLLLLHFIYVRFRNAQIRNVAEVIIDETNFFCRWQTRDCLFYNHKRAMLTQIDRYACQGFYAWDHPDQLSLGPVISRYIEDRFRSFGAGGEYIDYIYLFIQGLQLLSPSSFDFEVFIYCETHLSKRHYQTPWVMDCIKELHHQNTSSYIRDIEFFIIKHLLINKSHYDEKETKIVDRINIAKTQFLQNNPDIGEHPRQDANTYTEALIDLIESKF